MSKVKENELQGIHDLGGMLCEPFSEEEHDYLPWEKRVHALRELLARKKLLSVDELRRNVEGMGAEEYLARSYYEQWIWAMSQVMIEKGVVTSHELAKRMEQIKSGQTA